MRNTDELRQLQKLDLRTMILWTVQKIQEGYEGAVKMGRPVHLNFSGGVDSVALRRLIEMALPGIEVPIVFSDTGMEFSQMAAFARKYATHVVRPKMFFHDVVKKCGYPAISKQQARYLHDLQNPTERNQATRNLRMNGIRKDGQEGNGGSRLSRKYLYLIKGPSIGDGCCKHLKEDPLDNWAKANGGSIPIVGVQAEESDRRTRDWINWGCVGLKKKTPKLAPMMIWTKSRVLEFILLEQLEYCHEIYGQIVQPADCPGQYTTTGEKRTGCCGCAFGCFHDPLRFARLYVIDFPKWNYLMNNGLRKVLEWLHIPAYPGQYENYELPLSAQAVAQKEI